MLKLFQQRKETIKNKRISLLQVRKEEKVRKEKLKQLEMEILTKKQKSLGKKYLYFEKSKRSN